MVFSPWSFESMLFSDWLLGNKGDHLFVVGENGDWLGNNADW